MNNSDTTLEIRTLGYLSISIDGKQVATDWPNDTIKTLFCSLLSPMDVHLSWDRICLTMWDIPDSRIVRNRLEELFIEPLNCFLIRELGVNPLISDDEGMTLDQQHIHLDALDFYRAAVEGNRLLANGNNSAATTMFRKADQLYTGIFLPRMYGTIIEKCRTDLEQLHRTVVKANRQNITDRGYSDCHKRDEYRLYQLAA